MRDPNRDGARPYEKPILREPKSNQAILFLTGHAYIGDKGARDLLELLFPEPTCPTDLERTVQNGAALKAAATEERLRQPSR